MEVKVLFTTSRRIAPKFKSIVFGKYTVEPIPSAKIANVPATDRYLLRFTDNIDQKENRSNPVGEAKHILSLFSIFVGTQLKIESFMIDSVNIGQDTQDSAALGITGVLNDILDMELLIKKFNGLDKDIGRQFLRAADLYKTAVNLMGENDTLSYFLLTVAIECLSNTITSGKGTCDKFISFILTYLNDKTQVESEQDWKELLKEIYYRHRSGFTHGGKKIPEAVGIADRLNKIYIRNIIDGKEVRSPSLKWFESVVRNTLIGFLMSQNNTSNLVNNLIKEVSLEEGVIKLLASRSIEAGSPVTDNDFRLD